MQETAINIAYSCRLLTDDMKEIVVIDGQTHTEVEVQLKDTKTTFDRIMNSAVSALPSACAGTSTALCVLLLLP